MSKIYDFAFRMGVLFNVVLWTFLNIISYLLKQSDYLRSKSNGITFSGDYGFYWGFPFKMFLNGILWEPYAFVLKVLIYVACGFFFGFLFKFVRSKISSRRIAVK